MCQVVEFSAVENTEMAKVMLEPTCLRLAGHHQTGRHQPRQPAVATAPQGPPGTKVEEEDMSKHGEKEQRTGSKHSLIWARGGGGIIGQQVISALQ